MVPEGRAASCPVKPLLDLLGLQDSMLYLCMVIWLKSTKLT